MAWSTVDDFQKDLWEYSGMDMNNKFKHAPPRTIIDFQNKMSANRGKSIFDEENSDGVTHFICGRGKGFKNITITPGAPISTDSKHDDELRKKIREVSGFGHSNEFIMESLNLPKYSPSSSKTASISSEEVEEFEDAQEPAPSSPPPLSEILKRGRLDHKKKTKKPKLQCLQEFPPL